MNEKLPPLGTPLMTRPHHCQTMRGMSAPETTENGLFEGLFVRALDVSGPLAEELKAAGFDRQRPRPKYSSEVFRECLEVARRHRYPELSREDALHAMGRAFFGGFRQTILGSVMTAALSVLGPRTLLTKIPGRLQRLRTDVRAELQKRSDKEFVLSVQDPVEVGDFFAGAMEEGLKLAGATQLKLTSQPRPGGWSVTILLG